jgi:hypothetical protein
MIRNPRGEAMQDYERTTYEALLDIRYNARLHLRSCRYYANLRWGAAIISLIGGSGALISAIQASHLALFACGMLVAIASAADIVGGWAEKGARHQVWRKAHLRLAERAPALSVEEIDAALLRLESEVDDEVEGLRVPAYNDNVRSNGRDDYVMRESLVARVMRAIS